MEDIEKECRNYPNNPQEGRIIRSFGRIKSRKFSDHKKLLLENFLPLYEIKNFDSSQLKTNQKTALEIGFGFGDFLFENAKKDSDILFFGAEPHLNGVVNLLAKLEIEPLKNLKITTEDARPLLQKFPAEFFDKIFILFADPWPKAKHFKRRLITAEFLDKVLSPKMKSGAKLVIATDHDSYKIWILSEISRSKKFTWLAESKKDWQIFPQDWVITKYQKKAANEGRVSVIFNLIHNA